MSEWTSLSCKEGTKERVKEHQADDEGQDDVLNRALDALETQNEIQDLGSGNQTVGEIHDVKGYPVDGELDEMQETLEEIRERMIELDIASQNKRVLGELKDMKTELKTHFETELRK